jgi:hypothetical protein
MVTPIGSALDALKNGGRAYDKAVARSADRRSGVDTQPMARALTNYSYPGVCFTKYAPGPADQPNRSNLTV